MTEREIFTAALEINDPTERARYVDEACAGDADLRRRVEELLAMESHVGDFMEQPLAAISSDLFESSSPWDMGTGLPTTSRAVDPLLKSGSLIGPYELLEQIGRGGMGQVWRAEQQQPVRRTVALKVINPGMDSQAVLARFDAERQALELMEHDHIAKILDAGSTADGRPYFVMELVQGIAITRYCDEHQLDVRQRLQLFADVCQAVQHAHQKGIIHRDIKPSNVLVADHDDRPFVKVIDFGIAKAIHDRLTERTAFTQLGQVVGTLEYMSPEQARLSARDIDTRSDIYSLGVLLYELLTGTTPFERQRLREAAFDEMLRVIREDEPPRPSDKLSTGDTLPSVAALRGVEPLRLSRLVRGDLDWVVMKALEKDRERRYASASALSADVVHYLQDEPVSAGPPSGTYRLRKFLRRNKKSVIAGSVVLFALVGGLAAASWGWQSAHRAAEAERLARSTAESRLKQIENGNKVLASIFDDLNPNSETAEQKPLRAILADRLGDAAVQLAAGEIGDPVTVAKLQYRLATSLRSLGFPERALDVFGKARDVFQTHLGTDAQETLNATHEIAASYAAMGQFDRSLSLNKELLSLKQRILGQKHADTLATISNIAGVYQAMGKTKEAAEQYEQALDLFRERLGPDHTATLTVANNLSQAWIALGQTDRAVALLEQVLAKQKQVLAPGHENIRSTMNCLAVAYRTAGKYELALPLMEEVLAAYRGGLGPDHPKTLASAHNLSVFLAELGRTQEALPILEEVLRLRKVKLGREHPDTLASLNLLAQAYHQLGKLDQAVPLYKEALEQRRRILGANHPSTLGSMNDLAAAYLTLGEFGLAVPMLTEVLATRQTTLGTGHAQTLQTMTILARAYRETGKQQLALSLYNDALKRSQESLGSEHLHTVIIMAGLAKTLGYSEKYADGIALAEESLHLATTRFGEMPGDLINLPIVLANLYHGADRLDDAEELLRKSLKDNRMRFGGSASPTVRTMAALGKVLFARKQFDEAESIVRECLELRLVNEADAWGTFHTQCLLGAIMMHQDKMDQATPLLKQGYLGLQQQASRIPQVDREKTLAEVAGWMDEWKAAAEPSNAKSIPSLPPEPTRSDDAE